MRVLVCGGRDFNDGACVWATLRKLDPHPTLIIHGYASSADTQAMIGKPDLVVAFPGGRGTADMVRRAKAAGVPVIEASRRASR